MVYTSLIGPSTREPGLEVLSLVIDRSKSLDELVRAGGYDCTSPHLTEANFSSETDQTGLSVGLLHLDRRTRVAEVYDELAKRGLRGSSIHTLAVIGAQYPDRQRHSPIVALGSLWLDPDGDYAFGYLEGDSAVRGFGLHRLDVELGASCRFLATFN